MGFVGQYAMPVALRKGSLAFGLTEIANVRLSSESEQLQILTEYDKIHTLPTAYGNSKYYSLKL
jgi:hypothetical protein